MFYYFIIIIYREITFSLRPAEAGPGGGAVDGHPRPDAGPHSREEEEEDERERPTQEN